MVCAEDVLASCCLRAGAKLDMKAEPDDLGGHALGSDLDRVVVEVVGTEVLVLGAVRQHVVDGASIEATTASLTGVSQSAFT